METWKDVPEFSITEQHAAVDWLTVTSSDEVIKQDLLAACLSLTQELKALGNDVKPWKFKGYEGWLVESLRWGRREDGDIVMMSGEVARINYADILHRCDNASRIDLAVTVYLNEPITDLAFNIYNDLVKNQEKGGAGPRKFSFVESDTGGQTVYIGSRFSDQFGRVYDKGREVPELVKADFPIGKMWRYEVEFKAYRAKRVARQIIDEIEKKGDVHGSIGATVHKWFAGRVPYLLMDIYGNLEFLTEISMRISDDDTTLRWLSTQVRPSVERLASKGKIDQVKKALGIGKLDKEENL